MARLLIRCGSMATELTSLPLETLRFDHMGNGYEHSDMINCKYKLSELRVDVF